MPKQSTSATVHIDGYRSLVRDLATLAPDAEQAVKAMNVRISDRIIASAQARASAAGRQATRAAGQLRAFKSARAGGVNLRATRAVPYAMGAEFGARRPQLPPWRGSGTNAGYFLWPAIREADVLQQYSDELADLVAALAHGGGE